MSVYCMDAARDAFASRFDLADFSAVQNRSIAKKSNSQVTHSTCTYCVLCSYTVALFVSLCPLIKIIKTSWESLCPSLPAFTLSNPQRSTQAPIHARVL